MNWYLEDLFDKDPHQQKMRYLFTRDEKQQ